MITARWNLPSTQNETAVVRIFAILFFTLTIGLLTACGAQEEPTPTPTKTPHSAAPAADDSTSSEPAAATATPVPVPATATPVPTAKTVAEVATEPQPVVPGNVAPYTGLTVADPSLLRRRPVFVCVNNDAVGRSAHFGLGLADVVYEYIVDGFTMTRLTAIYHSQSVDRIGPVRSARMPNIWMTYMYDGVLACSGGSDEIRYLLKNEVTFPYLDADIDDPSNNRYFSTVGTDYRTRMQVSTDGVRRWLSDNGKTIDWARTGFGFSPDVPPSAAGATTQMQIAYPGGNSVIWSYDAGRGGYVRTQGGVAQTDPATGQPIVAANVIVMAAEHEETDIVEDSLGTKSIDVKLWGFGDLRIFRDGQVYEGTWRADPETPPRWLGPGDVIIQLKPGQSWVQVVRDKSELSY